MPKRISRPKRPSDPNQLAYQIVQLSTAENVLVGQDTLTKEQVSRIMAEMGRKGGKVGGKRSLETMSAADRRKRAKKAAKARWNPKK
jgi:hypothetical protein